MGKEPSAAASPSLSLPFWRFLLSYLFLFPSFRRVVRLSFRFVSPPSFSSRVLSYALLHFAGRSSFVRKLPLKWISMRTDAERDVDADRRKIRERERERKPSLAWQNYRVRVTQRAKFPTPDFRKRALFCVWRGLRNGNGLPEHRRYVAFRSKEVRGKRARITERQA